MIPYIFWMVCLLQVWQALAALGNALRVPVDACGSFVGFAVGVRHSRWTRTRVHERCHDQQPQQRAVPSTTHEFFLPKDDRRRFDRIEEFFSSLPMPLLDNDNNLPTPVPHPNPARKLRPTYAMIVSYRGNHFPGGFEPNPSPSPGIRHHPAATVRGSISDRVTASLGQGYVAVAAAGRTDVGVSAKANMFSFATKTPIPDLDSFRDDFSTLTTAQSSSQSSSQSIWDEDNNCNDNDMTIHRIQPVHASFHATFSTMAREYLYVLPLMTKSANNEQECERRNEYLQTAKIAQLLLQQVLGIEVDYYGISAGKLKTKDTLCKLDRADVWLYDRNGQAIFQPESQHRLNEDRSDVVPGFGSSWKWHCNDQQQRHLQEQEASSTQGAYAYSSCMVFRVRSNRFLRRMMRKLVNSVLQEASLLLDEEEPACFSSLDGNDDWKQRWKQRLELKDRSNCQPAPPAGLCLWRVYT